MLSEGETGAGPSRAQTPILHAPSPQTMWGSEILDQNATDHQIPSMRATPTRHFEIHSGGNTTKFCEACGKPFVRPDLAFCGHCGTESPVQGGTIDFVSRPTMPFANMFQNSTAAASNAAAAGAPDDPSPSSSFFLCFNT